MSKVLLSSGGMDSFLLAHEPKLKGAVHVFADIGQQYFRKELKAAQHVAESCGAEFHCVKTLNMAQFEHRPTGIIPFRNAELILCSAQYGEHIYLGIIADEVNSDKSPEFLRAMTQVLNISHRGQYWTEGKKFHLHTPFKELTKTQLILRYLDRGGDITHLLKSVSCYDGGKEHCGRCSSCFKRWVALTCATGRDYSDTFAQHPGKWKTKEEWHTKLDGYPERRVHDVFAAFSIAGM